MDIGVYRIDVDTIGSIKSSPPWVSSGFQTRFFRLVVFFKASFGVPSLGNSQFGAFIVYFWRFIVFQHVE